MRFLFGILTGGALTWAASVMFGDYLPSPGPTFHWLGAQFAPEEIAEATHHAPAVAVADDAPRANERAATHAPVPRAIAPPREPAPAADARAADTQPADAPADDDQPGDDSGVALARVDEQPPGAPAADAVDTPPAASFDESPVVIAPEPSGWESAWVPFQTQRSALGFAHVLTRQVQHPFEVRREASQRYRVTFAYADEAERERVLAAVRSLTGTRS